MKKQVIAITIVVITLSAFSVSEDVNDRTKPDPSLMYIFGPLGVDYHEMTTCEEFTSNSRFNPFSVIETNWAMFYSWAPDYRMYKINFFAPTQKEIRWMKSFMEPQVKDPINWEAKILVMNDRSDNSTNLLVEQGDRGQYHLYKLARFPSDEKLEPVDIRFKQTSDNRYLGLMLCKKDMVYVFCRENDIPKKTNIQDAAATMKYRARGGRSYLYQGHHWLPIPEASEEAYWTPKTKDNWHELEYSYD